MVNVFHLVYVYIIVCGLSLVMGAPLMTFVKHYNFAAIVMSPRRSGRSVPFGDESKIESEIDVPTTAETAVQKLDKNKLPSIVTDAGSLPNGDDDFVNMRHSRKKRFTREYGRILRVL